MRLAATAQVGSSIATTMTSWLVMVHICSQNPLSLSLAIAAPREIPELCCPGILPCLGPIEPVSLGGGLPMERAGLEVWTPWLPTGVREGMCHASRRDVEIGTSRLQPASGYLGVDLNGTCIDMTQETRN